MRKRYDSYEIEIIISLGFLILFLISINFISGYSFQRARRLQSVQFENSVHLAAQYVCASLERDIVNWNFAKAVDSERLYQLLVVSGVKEVAVADTLGRIIAATTEGPEAGNLEERFTVKRPLRSRNGDLLGYVIVADDNAWGRTFRTLTWWDGIFRVAGLIASLIVGALFLKAVLIPYRRIRQEAMDYNLDLTRNHEGRGIEYVVNTFKEIIAELDDKRKQLEIMYSDSEKRAASLARYNEHILGSISSGVVICDSSGIVTRFNRSAENILRYFEKDCRGKHYREIFGADHSLTAMLDDALLHRIVHSRLEFEVRRPDGQKLWLGCSSSMINDEKGDGMGAVLLMIDLTEIRHLQEISAYAEKMASLGETSAGLAHEIRNSFAAIIGFANLLRKDAGDNCRIKGSAEAIRDEALAAESLLTQFLNFAKPLQLNPQTIDLNALITSAIRSVSEDTIGNIRITTDLADSIPPLCGDPLLLRQALTNLLLNACQAMPNGGEIRVRVKLREAKDDKTRGWVRISVTDSGTGIDEEKLDKVFEPFFTSKPDGTGLGLAMVKKIVVLHGGRVEALSKPGKGSRFTIYLPLRPKEQAGNRVSPSSPSATANKERRPGLSIA